LRGLPFRLVSCAVALGLVTVLWGTGCSSPSCNACIEASSATFDLTCAASNLTSIAVSGPCAADDASIESFTTYSFPIVAVDSPTPGVCHIKLTFATGFTYSTDVTFASTTAGSCSGCPSYIGATSGPFMVHNPSNTCVDASAGVEASDAGAE
jgi:hypothetical protein